MAQFQLKNDWLKSQNIRASIRNSIINFICCACYDSYGFHHLEEKAGVWTRLDI